MYVVIGGRGYLGSYLIKNIQQSCSEKIIATYHSEENLAHLSGDNIIWQKLDIANVESVNNFAKLIAKHKTPNTAVKCVYVAGYIRPDNCIKNPEIALNVNIGGLVNFLQATKNIIDGLIFTSTDFVAGESVLDHKFKEAETPHPVNFFGSIKRACEQIVLLENYNVVRLPFMFGRSLIAEKPHFIEHIERTIQNKEYFDVLADYYENSLDYDTVAKCIYGLFAKYGPKIPAPIIHIASDRKISKYEIAVEYAKKRGLDPQYLRPLSLKEADFFLAKRCTILLDNTLLKELLNLENIEHKI